MMSLLADPRARRAYLLTKLAVFLLAAVATVGLARLVGPVAWLGLGVFGVLLAVISGVVLAADRVMYTRDDATGDEPPSEPDAEVVLPIEDSLDLHSFPPAQVTRVVESYLEAAAQRGFAEVRLIHGRGIGVQRERVRSLLARHPLIESFRDATPDGGGWGATVVRLRHSGTEEPVRGRSG